MNTLPFGEFHREYSVIPGIDGAWPARALCHHAEGNAERFSRLDAAVHHCLRKHTHFIQFIYCFGVWSSSDLVAVYVTISLQFILEDYIYIYIGAI